MRILTVNTGSASVKLALYELAGNRPRAVSKTRYDDADADPAAQLERFLDDNDGPAIDAVAHRVVHGGARMARPVAVTADVEAEIEALARLAPLHNPRALEWIRACRDRLGDGIGAVAVFDTAYYRTLPAVASTYAIPGAWSKHAEVRRYGFHGIAHQAMWTRWCALRPDLERGGRLISLQLGGGCSVTASHHGVPRDTSMGFSPLEGLVMATRAGDLDPALILYVQRALGLEAGTVERMLNMESGLLGVSGRSEDMRTLLNSRDARAELAVALYCYRASKYIGAYLSVLEGTDGIVFGGGVGEHLPAIREKILAPLRWCGLRLDPKANAAAVGEETRISRRDSAIDVRVIPVDEEHALAAAAAEVLTDKT